MHRSLRNSQRMSFRRRASIGITDYEIRNEKSSLIASLVMLYGMCMILCGAVFPISDALAMGSNNKKHGLKVIVPFHLVQYTLSILALLYLLIVIKHYETRKEKLWKKNQQHKKKKMKKKKRRNCCNCCSTEEGDAENDAMVPAHIRVAYDRHSSGSSKDENDDNVFPSADSQENIQNGQPRTLSVQFSNLKEAEDQAEEEREEDEKEDDEEEDEEEEDEDEEATVIEHNLALVGQVSQMSEGINLYLRLGAVGFGFGVMVHDGFKISDHLQDPHNNCHRNILWVPKVLVHFVYVFIQTYFVFKYHRIVFNCQKAVIRLCLTHLAITNVGQWLKTVVFEITEDLRRSPTMMGHKNHSLPKELSHLSLLEPKRNHHNITTGAHHVCDGGFSEKLSPFLYPCAIEYSLIAGAIFFKMFQKVGHMLREGRRYRTSRSAEGEGPLSGCHKSHRGLFIGLLVFIASLVSLALFFVFSSKFQNSDHASYVYQVTEMGLLLSTTSACCIALLQFRKLDFHHLSEGGAFDDNLLLIGFAGVMGYSLFLLLPSVKTYTNDGNLAALLFSIKAAMEMIQAFIQVLFIIEASRRRACDVEQFMAKPGRSMVTFLIVINLAMWVINTFEVKRAESHSIYMEYYNELPWSIISRIFLPLIIFFRFHSTVCLSDIWTGAYKYYRE